MRQVQFTMIGGFLGAGKTTTVGHLARLLQARGRKVAVITNDQAAGLVDSHNLAGQGFAVREVPGACFCCSFPRLLDSITRLADSERPDVILGEPVGSCTDLAATVVRPLRDLYAGCCVVTPLVVLIDPQRVRKVLAGGGLSPRAAYIYRKQLEEADVLALNKIDALTPTEIEDITGLINRHYPHTPLQAISGRTGAGLDLLLDNLADTATVGGQIVEVDYDVYAAGEAELGWLNSTLACEGPAPFSLDDMVLRLVNRIGDALRAAGADVAHLKVLGRSHDREAVANLVRSDADAELSRTSCVRTCHAELIVNVRAFAAPEQLSLWLHQALDALEVESGLCFRVGPTQSFRPGRPVPTHRLAGAF